MAVLIGMSGELKGKTFNLDTGAVTLGRSADNTISINSPAVSGHHASITFEDEHYVLRDVGSTNGTRVNAKDVTDVVLKPKDLIQFGSVELLFNSEVEATDDGQTSYAPTQVEVSQDAVTRPQSFESISPFGARRRENTTLWIALIVVVAILALGGVGYFIYKLMFSE
jgi:pSer/pThr/pTyr-binding forkhead associated (FHA) protein